MKQVAEQLDKVRRVSSLMHVVINVAAAFTGLGLAFSLIGLAFAGSFQLNLGDGDLAVTFFSADPQQAIVYLYDAKRTVGVNINADVPPASEVTRLVTDPALPLRAATGVMMFLNTTVMLNLLAQLARLFGHYVKGEIFTRAVVVRIRNIGYALLGFPFVALLNSAFGVFLVSRFGTASDSAHVSVPMLAVAAALVVLLVSWIMDVGRALQEEQELVI